MPKLEGPATKIYNYVPGAIWGDKEKKKKKQKQRGGRGRKETGWGVGASGGQREREQVLTGKNHAVSGQQI